MRGDVPRGDVIVFAEVLEHLHCAPEHVLSWLASRLAPGGRIVLQTPNAVAAHKRALMLLGRHPFERLRLDPSCPGHVREHTLHELREYAREAGLRVERVIRASYFDYRFRLDAKTHRHVRTPWGAAGNVAYAAMPGFLARGITMVLAREGDG
jgi:2-polyprenyl-3-methyl-5-hydroxy-6-metoxy-1,4-benzoquinol methylase